VGSTSLEESRHIDSQVAPVLGDHRYVNGLHLARAHVRHRASLHPAERVGLAHNRRGRAVAPESPGRGASIDRARSDAGPLSWAADMRCL